MLTDTLERMRRDAHLPDINGERCVHAVCAEATCRACLEACPHGAWVFDEDSLGIDTAACDGCGRCIPVCPTGALWFTEPIKPARRRERGSLVAFAACSPSGVQKGDGQIPCLHAIGLGDLLELARVGVRRLVVAQGTCDDCPRASGSAPHLKQTLDTVNRLLESRGAPPLTLKRRDAEGWQRHLTHDTDPESGPAIGRRNFFRLAATKVVAETTQATSAPDCPAFVPPASRLPAPSEGAESLYPWVPTIEAMSCNGCHACVRICPTGALNFATEPDRYVLDAAACTACRLCENVCQAGAVSLTALVSQTQSEFPLESARCRACGTTFHVPQGHPPANGLCRICGRTNHYKKLFQVFP